MNYKYNKYIFNEKENIFFPIKFDLSKFTNIEIINTFSNGIQNIIDYNFLLNKFGINVIDVKASSFLYILVQNLFFNPTYYYVVL